MPIPTFVFQTPSFNHRLLSILIGLSVITPNLSGAAPLNGVVTGGDASITVSGDNTAINQTTDRLSIDWDSFNISADERVEFLQPGQNSIALNRILSNDSSQIFGQIDANGHVILMNPNGLVFGESAEVNVGGLIATGLNIDATDFMNGELVFQAVESGDGVVVNRGLINAASGGNVALLGRTVANEGFISADLGTVSLASGDQAVLTFDDTGMLGVQVTEETLRELGGDALVSNTGEINATDGQVLLTSKVSQDIFSGAVNTDLPEGEMGVEVHEDGSFTLSGRADVVNAGVIDTSSSGGGAGFVELRGDYIEHSGSIWVHAAESYPRHTTVTLAGSDGVVIDNGQIADTFGGETEDPDESGSSGSTVTVTGDYISMTGAGISVGSYSEVKIGDRSETRRVFVDADAISTVDTINWSPGSGGDIAIAANTSVVVMADMNVRGVSVNYAEESDATDGGDILLDSGGRLALSGQINNTSGSDYGTAGELKLIADTLMISDSGAPFTINPEALNIYGSTRLQAEHSLLAEGESEIVLYNDFSAVVSGSEDGEPGLIDLRGLTLDPLHSPYERSELTIALEADNIVAPQIGVHYSLISTRPRGVDVELTANTGDIIHFDDVNTWSGAYTAEAAGDVRFEDGARLNTEQYEEYPENWVGGTVDVAAGGDIALTLGNARPGEIISRPWSAPTSMPMIQLTGRDVDLSLSDGAIVNESQNLANIIAENLVVTSAGDFSADAVVAGKTTLEAPSGGLWLMEGDYNLLSAQAGDTFDLIVTESSDLILGDMLFGYGSDSSLGAINAGATISQAPDSTIELPGSLLSLVADNIHLGADGTAEIIMSGAYYSSLGGIFGSSFALHGTIEFNGQNDNVTFQSAVDAADSRVTVGEHADFLNPTASPGSIRLGSGDHTVDLAADLPLDVYLGEGADIINLLAPELTYNLIDFDESLDTINPYVEPPPPSEGDPKPWPKPHHWGKPFWGYPHWYWKPGFAGYGHWGFQHKPKLGHHGLHWQPWFPSTFARR